MPSEFLDWDKRDGGEKRVEITVGVKVSFFWSGSSSFLAIQPTFSDLQLFANVSRNGVHIIRLRVPSS